MGAMQDQSQAGQTIEPLLGGAPRQVRAADSAAIRVGVRMFCKWTVIRQRGFATVAARMIIPICFNSVASYQVELREWKKRSREQERFTIDFVREHSLRYVNNTSSLKVSGLLGYKELRERICTRSEELENTAFVYDPDARDPR